MKASAWQSLLLLIILSSSCCLSANAGAGDHHELQRFMVVPTSSLKHIPEDATCSGHKVIPSNGTAWVPMNRPHGPCSSTSSRASEDMGIDVDDMLMWDQLRTSYIRTQLSTHVGVVGGGMPVIARSTTVSNRDYTPSSTASVGTNSGTSKTIEKSDQTATNEHQDAVSQTVVVDTSSDIPWVQCLPCPIPQCHLQKDPLYDPAKSSTFAPIPCGSPACKELGSSYGNGCSPTTDECKYIVNYGDGKATTGTYVTDTLTMSPTIVVKDFRFGCSHAVRGSFSNQNAGILALGGGRGSLLEQTADAYGNAFSYCIPKPSSAGFLSLGGPVEASLKFSYTPLIKNKHAPTFYIVHLEAIIVAGKQLVVPPTAFATGAVMDSGAVVTQLPPQVYAALRAAFRSAMAAYGPLAAPVRNLDTCYDFTHFPEVKVPKVSLVFAGGATLDLEPASIILDGCLAFAATPSEESVGFIGNVQQQTYEVLYDVGGGKVGFRRGAC
ncbi:Aspartic proteinase nepenthesin-2 [Hordeum vulgare]|nr:Aspartic proteinase nepenthesin-2 [Hordeum vulgare]